MEITSVRPNPLLPVHWTSIRNVPYHFSLPAPFFNLTAPSALTNHCSFRNRRGQPTHFNRQVIQ